MEKNKDFDNIKFENFKKDLIFYKDFWCVLYGSQVNETNIPNRSDVDVAIITKIKDKEKNLKIWREMLEKTSKKYEIRIFELLPLYIQIEIINSNFTLFGNKIEISEYFYQYRKNWDTMKFRIEKEQFKNVDEKIQGIKLRKRIKKNKESYHNFHNF